MGLEYFGVLHEDKDSVIVVPLGSHVNPEDVEKADWLLRLEEEIDDLIEDVDRCETIFSFKSIRNVSRIVDLVEKAFNTSHHSVVIYGLFCKYFNIKPRVVSEVDLKNTGKHVVVLGREV